MNEENRLGEKEPLNSGVLWNVLGPSLIFLGITVTAPCLFVLVFPLFSLARGGNKKQSEGHITQKNMRLKAPVAFAS